MRLAVFASGNGTNFEAIADAVDAQELHAEIVLVVSDQCNAAVVQKAKHRRIKTVCFKAKAYPDKCAYESMILRQLRELGVELIVLAGYMRIVGSTLLKAYPHRIINIHPSLLPKYKGLDALGQALDQGDDLLGASVHYVDEHLDGGAIIEQASFRCYKGQKREEIEKELHRVEHRLYVAALKRIVEEHG